MGAVYGTEQSFYLSAEAEGNHASSSHRHVRMVVSRLDWRVLPQGTAAGEYLPFYTERYPVVEVDSTVYRSPSRKMVEGWFDKTPDGFGFSLKVPQAITHEKRLTDCETELAAFLSAAQLLGDKLLCCCLQFGYFNKKAFASLDGFLERLDPFLAE
jgi:uncharacterized protein YecE (DUF72 family)